MEQEYVLSGIVTPLMEWFRLHARVLPWREQPLPYRVWVSEIMLQQTRVEAVIPYYERFMKALPDIYALAGCEEEILLKLWEGLGYYNRVRNMQQAARRVLEVHDGQLPADYEKLCSLKGIGEYTAGAIASIAYQIPVPAVDGNVCRVISRVLLSYDDILKASTKKKITGLLQEVIPEREPGTFNQALMELGALVCVPNGRPHCHACPLAEQCKAHLENKTDELPVKTPAKRRRIEKRTILILRDGNKIAIRRRSQKGLLAGLYELPNEEGYFSQNEALKFVTEKGFIPLDIRRLEPAKHIFSHVEWHMTAYLINISDTDQVNDYIFVDTKETEDTYPIPSAFEAYMSYVQVRLGQNRYKEE